MEIRRACLSELQALTELTKRSKAYWGYDAEFMVKAEPELTIRPEKFGDAFLVFVLQNQNHVLGFYSLIPKEAKNIELHDLFVEPSEIGKGRGKQLWNHAVQTAKLLGYQRMVWTADPHAESFYQRRGAVTRSYLPSPVMADRMLPHMEYQLFPATL